MVIQCSYFCFLPALFCPSYMSLLKILFKHITVLLKTEMASGYLMSLVQTAQTALLIALHLLMAILSPPEHLHLISVRLLFSLYLPFVPLFLQFFPSLGNSGPPLSLVTSFPFVRLRPNPNLFMKPDKSNHIERSSLMRHYLLTLCP